MLLCRCQINILLKHTPFPQVDLAILESRVEKKKLAIEEAKAQAKGLLPDGTPNLDTVSGFSPAPKTGWYPCPICVVPHTISV